MSAPQYRFHIHAERLAIARLAADAPLPQWAAREFSRRGAFTTLSRTEAELSVVCAQSAVPQGIVHERDKLALGIEGTIAMTTIGVLAALCRTLADASVPVFVISTYDTDWLLVSASKFAAARAALESAGHSLHGAAPSA